MLQTVQADNLNKVFFNFISEADILTPKLDCKSNHSLSVSVESLKICYDYVQKWNMPYLKQLLEHADKDVPTLFQAVGIKSDIDNTLTHLEFISWFRFKIR